MALPSAATTLRQSLQDPKAFITAPGVYDGMSARLALAAGFDALYMVRKAPQTPAMQQSSNHERPALEPQPPSMDKPISPSAR